MLKQINCDVLIIGSGPGGAVTASILAKAGRDVVLVEEGPAVSAEQAPSYSLQEMDLKYRHAGLSPALGNPKVAYVEGCCLGGASEINAGLYHRPLAQTLDGWRDEFKIKDFGNAVLESYFQANEAQMSIVPMPQLGPASKIIDAGARQLHWKASEVPRMWQYIKNSDGSLHEARQSMSQTLIPQAVQAGCRVLSQTKIIKLNGSLEAIGKMMDAHGRQNNIRIRFKDVFVCAGAIQTPFLLRRSGMTRNVGNALRMHPAMRVIGRFDQPVNGGDQEGVPVFQVQEFKPELTLGGSYSGLPHLALWLAGSGRLAEYLKDYKHMAIFYALITARGTGRVRHLPFLDEPMVSFDIPLEDLKALGEGLYRLGELLFAAGAKEIYSPVKDQKPFRSLKDMAILRQGLPRDRIDLSTIHLFCSCPMGEDAQRCAVDSFGKMHGLDHFYVNDASILPSTPGVNPQATIMAIARRNAEHFLQ